MSQSRSYLLISPISLKCASALVKIGSRGIAFRDRIDPAYWEAKNLASIAKANPDKIRVSALQIYLDCGDEDMFLLFEGSEFLYRVLYDAGLKHEYHRSLE